MVAGEEYRAYLFVGVISIDGEAQASVWVETRNKAVEPRRRIVAAADAAGLGDEWVRDMGSWGGLHKVKRLVSFATHEEVVRWFIESLGELGEAGILELIPALGRAEPADVADEDADPIV
jgi:hypothetical protein